LRFNDEDAVNDIDGVVGRIEELATTQEAQSGKGTEAQRKAKK